LERPKYSQLLRLFFSTNAKCFALGVGVKVAGHRGYFLTGVGVALNQAIINYGLQFLTKRKYKTMQTPMLMKKELMGRVAQLSDYDETLYKVRSMLGHFCCGVLGQNDDQTGICLNPLCGRNLATLN
jgi:seryl-tRNA synthetase